MHIVYLNITTIQPQKLEKIEDPDEAEEHVHEPAWPHLQIIYEFFLRFVVASDLDSKLLKKYINNNFVLNILELFDSEDARERGFVF